MEVLCRAVHLSTACILFLTACNGELAVEDLSRAPEVKPADRPFAGVFAPLDGVWKGRFRVFEDSRGQQSGGSRPADVERAFPDPTSLSLIQVIDVTQEYASESPFFQRVRIRDVYTDGKGETRTVTSQGVNKVQDGRLFCVVVKPDETVVHRGSLDGKRTIIWKRALDHPQKIECFRETVLPDTYTIKGWGYYGGDDTDLSPRIWFRAAYWRTR